MIDKCICQPKNAKNDRQGFVKRGVFSGEKFGQNTKLSQAVNKKSLTGRGTGPDVSSKKMGGPGQTHKNPDPP